jgi:hypothetical protein
MTLWLVIGFERRRPIPAGAGNWSTADRKGSHGAIENLVRFIA